MVAGGHGTKRGEDLDRAQRTGGVLMRSKVIASVGALIIALATTIVGFASPAYAHCSGHSWSNRDSDTGRVLASGVRIRAYPHTSCTANGLAYPSHVLEYDCYTSGSTVTGPNGTMSTWTHVRNATTGVRGWVSDAYLNDYGSFVPCSGSMAQAAPKAQPAT